MTLADTLYGKLMRLAGTKSPRGRDEYNKTLAQWDRLQVLNDQERVDWRKLSTSASCYSIAEESDVKVEIAINWVCKYCDTGNTEGACVACGSPKGRSL